jgi:FAD/FMN-containing dehydrogenase
MSAPDFPALQREITAPLILPGDAGYEQARRIWNGMVDRHPLAIVQPKNAHEVAVAIGFARRTGIPLSVKGGGHGVAGKAICEGGLVIDLARMRAVQIDSGRRIAHVQGGATLRELDAPADAHDLATTAGVFCRTGVAGLALGGGIGLLMRRFGLTCDNILGAELVTADGRILEVNDADHPDLLWALRGGGANFGVVTRIDLQLHRLPRVFGGRLMFDWDDVPALSAAYADLMPEAPDDLQGYLAYFTTPGGLQAAVTICDTGDGSLCDLALQRLTADTRPTYSQVGETRYLRLQQLWDDDFPDGRLWYWKSSFFTGITAEGLAACAEILEQQRMPNCTFAFEPMGGAIGRVDATATPFADRDGASTLIITSWWTDPAESAERIAWVKDSWAALQPFATVSGYINYMDGDEARTQATFGPNFERLLAVKRAFDPGNVFQHTASFRP